MKVLTFSLFVIAVVFTLGCSAENPICSTNFCAIGEVFPRSELEDGQLFSEVDIDDSVIFATLVGGDTPVKTTPAVATTQPDTVTLNDIVSDVAGGGTTYLGKIVTITGAVRSDASGFTNNDTITLITNNENVSFYINSRETPDRLAKYKKDQTYTFNLFIRGVDPPDDRFVWYAIWSNLPNEKISTTMNALATDVAAGGRTYIDKVVSLRATIELDAANYFDEGEDYETISLITNNDKVVVFVTHELEHPSILAEYKEGTAYDFTIFIARITLLNDLYYVSAYIVLD